MSAERMSAGRMSANDTWTRSQRAMYRLTYVIDTPHGETYSLVVQLCIA